MRGKKGMDLEGKRGGEELGGVEEGETVIRVYCMVKQSIFNKRGKESKEFRSH